MGKYEQDVPCLRYLGMQKMAMKTNFTNLKVLQLACK